MKISMPVIIEAINAQDEIFDSKDLMRWLKKNYPRQVIEELYKHKLNEAPFCYLYETIAVMIRESGKVIEMVTTEPNDFFCKSYVHKWIKK